MSAGPLAVARTEDDLLPRHQRDRVRPVRGTFKNVIRIAPPLNAAEPQADTAPTMLEGTMTAST